MEKKFPTQDRDVSGPSADSSAIHWSLIGFGVNGRAANIKEGKITQELEVSGNRVKDPKVWFSF